MRVNMSQIQTEYGVIDPQKGLVHAKGTHDLVLLMRALVLGLFGVV